MWLHKHGLGFFKEQLSEIYKDIDTSVVDERLGDASYIRLINLTQELREHLFRIEEHLGHQDHDLLMIIKATYSEVYGPRVANMQTLTADEQSLHEKLIKLKEKYFTLSRRIRDLAEELRKKNLNNYSFKRNIPPIITLLSEIRSESKHLAKILVNTLSQLSDYKHLLESKEQDTNWAIKNIKSWIIDEKNDEDR